MVPCSTAPASGLSVGITRKRVRVASSRITAFVITVSVWYASVRLLNNGTEIVLMSGGRCVAAPSVWYPHPESETTKAASGKKANGRMTHLTSQRPRTSDVTPTQ